MYNQMIISSSLLFHKFRHDTTVLITSLSSLASTIMRWVIATLYRNWTEFGFKWNVLCTCWTNFGPREIAENHSPGLHSCIRQTQHCFGTRINTKIKRKLIQVWMRSPISGLKTATFINGETNNNLKLPLRKCLMLPLPNKSLCGQPVSSLGISKSN